MPASPANSTDRRLRVMLAIGSLGGGGSERQLLGLLRRLDRTQFEPHLYLMHDGGELREDVPEDVPVHIFWNQRSAPAWNWPGRIHRLQVADMRRQLQQWNIDCVYDRNFHTTLVTSPAAGLVPRISTVVSDPETDLLRQETRFVGLKRRRLQRAYRTADHVVAVSEGVRRALMTEFHVPGDRVTTIYSPVDFVRIQRLAGEEPAIAMRPDRFQVVGAGRLLEAKGWLDLVRAMDSLVNEQQLRFVQLQILGEGPLRPELQRLIDARGLRDFIQLPGFQANPYAIFSRADALCHPSHYEGLPNVLLEALACGLPVIATDCRWGPREILDDGRWGVLTDTQNPNQLAQALATLARQHADGRSSEHDAERVAAKKSYIVKTFGVDRSVERLQQLVLRVCGRDAAESSPATPPQETSSQEP